MTQMIFRPPYFFPDLLGNALNADLYIGKPNLDPTQPANQLECRDGVNGAILSQPIKVQNGIPKNTDDQTVLIVLPTQEYSAKYFTPTGREILGLSQDRFVGDALSVDDSGSGGTADIVFNNLVQATDANLDGINYIFIKGEASGWEGTAEGPTINTYFYNDGTTGAPSTVESPSKFYDTQGNGFSKASALYDSTDSGLTATNEQDAIDEIKGLTDTAQADATQAIADAAAAQTDATQALADAAAAQATADQALLQGENYRFKFFAIDAPISGLNPPVQLTGLFFSDLDPSKTYYVKTSFLVQSSGLNGSGFAFVPNTDNGYILARCKDTTTYPKQVGVIGSSTSNVLNFTLDNEYSLNDTIFVEVEFWFTNSTKFEPQLENLFNGSVLIPEQSFGGSIFAELKEISSAIN